MVTSLSGTEVNNLDLNQVGLLIVEHVLIKIFFFIYDIQIRRIGTESKNFHRPIIASLWYHLLVSLNRWSVKRKTSRDHEFSNP